MNEIVVERLAQRLLKCPFDSALFDSVLRLRLHLCDAHRTGISRPHLVACKTAAGDTERPKQLYCCPQCDFVVPDPFDQSPTSEILNHIRAEHPNPNRCEPVNLRFGVSTDEELIDGYMEQLGSIERRSCAHRECNAVFADDDSVALHWAEEHCIPPTAEEVRRELESHPGSLRVPLAEMCSEMENEETWKRLACQEPDDGYVIHHSPSVPRLRSRPTESIVYVEREQTCFHDRDLEELLELEGLDCEDEPPDTAWAEGNQQHMAVELRFCNILDGYIPLVRNVRRILPPLGDGEGIEVSWQAEAGDWFSCKVSRSKRAIYNPEGRLKRILEPFPSGVRVQITRVGTRRYRLGVLRRPHVVPNCKVFSGDGRGGWMVDIRDETVEWETGDQVFRHQLNFQQMEALRHEALDTGLSIRDAVYETMKRLARSRPVHVRTVHDAVFLWMRTCSLAAVWAQFRPEHTCYLRMQPGWYRFDPNGALPVIRVVSPSKRLPQYSRDTRRYRVKQRTWRHNIYATRLNDYRQDSSACLEVRCAFGTRSETVFVIPMPYLLQQVIPHADCNERGQYLFTVSPHDFVFTWDHGFRMEGRDFVESMSSTCASDNATAR